MQPLDEEKLNSMLGNLSDFVHEIDMRHEESDHKLKHGQTEFDGDDHTKPERELLQAVLEKYKKGELTQKNKPAVSENGRAQKPKKQNPRALMQKFWSTYGLTNEEIGRRYEIYIGWRYESNGWNVKYNGAINGLEDGGIDLICTKGNKILIVQCKNWKRDALMHEKHIYQLFGSASDYRINSSKGLRTGAAFYTSAIFSEKAREAAKRFHIMLYEQVYLERFPCIKCKTETHLYYIPYDEQYFTLSMDIKNGDIYCASIDEAESLGFNHA